MMAARAPGRRAKLVMSALIGVGLLSCRRHGGETPEAFYRRYLAARGVESGYSIPFTRRQAEEMVRLVRTVPRYADRPNDEMVDWLRTHSSRAWLEPVMEEVLNRAPHEYAPALRQVYVALNPSALDPDLQTYSLRTGDGGVLILVNHALVAAFIDWSTAIAALIASDEARTKDEQDKILNELAESIEGYRDHHLVPQGLLAGAAMDDRTEVLSVMLATRAIQFVLAHECGHAILGHLQHPDAPPQTFARAFDVDKEIAADGIAVEILRMQHQQGELGDMQAVVETELWRAGANLGLALIEIIEQGREEVSLQMTLRRMKLIGRLHPTRPSDEYPLTRLLNLTIQDLHNRLVCRQQPPTDKLPGDVRAWALFFEAYKRRDQPRMSEIVSGDPDGFRSHSVLMRDFAQSRVLAGEGTVHAKWSGCDNLSASDLVGLADAIDSVLRTGDQVGGDPSLREKRAARRARSQDP